ncbi:MAG: hypothetical protein D6705_08565 [Deltaproteobacteria bacterium]|nr:MAG: hypothetical protein D6705_08565 [Deltaproteobacteria bacterium]
MAEVRRKRARRGRTVRRARFVPFRHRDRGLAIDVLRFELDDGPSRDIASGTTTLDLSAHRFRRLSLDVEVRVPRTVVSYVLPETERSAPPLALLVVLACPSTRLRRVRRIPLETLAEETASVRLELLRSELRGEVEISAVLARIRNAAIAAPGYAAHAAAKVAGSASIDLLVDPPVRRAGGYLEIRYESFSKSPSFEPGTLYRLDCETDTPILFIDADDAAVRQILDSRGRRGLVARAREVVFDAIGQVVWLRLYMSAIAGADEDGTCAYGWQDGVLRRLLPKLYPDLSDHASRLEQLCADRADGGLESFVERLEALVQTEVRLSDHVRAVAKELG